MDANGRYVIAIARAGIPKVASNNRTTATPEENKAIVGGSITHRTYARASGRWVLQLLNEIVSRQAHV